VPNCDENKLLSSMKEQWKIQQQSSLSNQSILAITNKKLEKMEWIKKVLDTESKFLDDERKWVTKERQIILEYKTRENGPKNFMATYNSDSFDFMNSSMKGPKPTENDTNRNKEKLEIEIEVLEKLNQDVKLELDRINLEKIVVIDKEEILQKQKLNLLLQYDAIKKLEYFYNEYHSKSKQIEIEGIEIDHENMRELFQKYLGVSSKNDRYYDTKDRRMLLAFGLHKMIY
jgi:hypothetical protein